MTKEERLYKMLTQYSNILYCVERDYKPFVPKLVEEQIGALYSELYPNNKLRDWSCPACCLHNWKLFNNFYKYYHNHYNQNAQKKINLNS